jgi:integrase
MPRAQLMSWEGHPYYRWVKMHKGIRYRVSCEELGATIKTKEATTDLANGWWQGTLASLSPSPPPDVQTLQEIPDTQTLHELVEKGKAADVLLKGMGGQPASEETVRRVLADDLIGAVLADRSATVKQKAERLRAGIGDTDQERAERLGALVTKVSPPVERDRTFRHQAEKFLAIIQGEMKPLSFREIRDYVRSLMGEYGTLDVSAFDELKCQEVYLGLKNAKLSAATRKKRWGFFGRLIKHFWSSRLIELPRNLKELRFKTHARAIKTYETDEVRKVLLALPARLRLYMLLGLNCGMNAADVGQLRKDQVDFAGGRLVRRRVKIGDRANVPTVDYPLWAETARLLRECLSEDPTLALTAMNGAPLWESRQEGDKTPQKDLINQQWKRAKVSIPFKACRSISATMLDRHENYGRFAEYFLGHTPKTVAEEHYQHRSTETFDKAMGWLRTQLLGEGDGAE